MNNTNNRKSNYTTTGWPYDSGPLREDCFEIHQSQLLHTSKSQVNFVPIEKSAEEDSEYAVETSRTSSEITTCETNNFSSLKLLS